MKASCEEQYDEAQEYRQIEAATDFWLIAFYVFGAAIGIGLVLTGLSYAIKGFISQ